MGIQRIQAQCGVCPLKGLQGCAYIRNTFFFEGGIHTTEGHSAALEEMHHVQILPGHHLRKGDELRKDAEILQQQKCKAMAPLPAQPCRAQTPCAAWVSAGPSGAACGPSHPRKGSKQRQLSAQNSDFSVGLQDCSTSDHKSHSSNGTHGAYLQD